MPQLDGPWSLLMRNPTGRRMHEVSRPAEQESFQRDTSWWTRTTRPSRTTGPVRPIIVQTLQVMLDTSALENTFDYVGQSMLQLARAQDQTNRQLQQHIQQGQANMQAHTGALQQLATSTYPRNFNHIFASIPIYARSDREGVFPWLDFLEAA